MELYTPLEMDEKDYRSLNRYANSDLSEFKRLLLGDTRPRPERAFYFGKMVHQMLMEPDKITSEDWLKLTTEEQEKSNKMYKAAKKDTFLSEVLKYAEREKTYFFEAENLPCKAKIDLVLDDTIVDIKTTSSQNYIEFLDAASKFDYHRQGAFYLDATEKCKNFVLLGIQKHEPYEVFYFELSAYNGIESIPNGRKEYRRLLNQIKTTNFVPSKWQK